MAGPRPVWKGFLKVSLVTVPIRVFPATESSGSLSFNQLHEPCNTRVQQKKWCAGCQREIPNSEIVKGYEFEAGRYVVLTDEDLEAVKPASTRVIDLVQFGLASALDPVAIDRSYYLAPDGSREAYAVLLTAMAGKVGIGTVSLYGREYLVAVRPGGAPGACVLHTLHHAAEIRSSKEFGAPPVDPGSSRSPADIRQSLAQVRLAKQIVAALMPPDPTTLDLATYEDTYRAGLQKVIDAKIAGEAIVVPPAPTPAMVNLRDALEQSLQAIQATGSARARMTPVTPAARLARRKRMTA